MSCPGYSWEPLGTQKSDKRGRRWSYFILRHTSTPSIPITQMHHSQSSKDLRLTQQERSTNHPTKPLYRCECPHYNNINKRGTCGSLKNEQRWHFHPKCITHNFPKKISASHDNKNWPSYKTPLKMWMSTLRQYWWMIFFWEGFGFLKIEQRWTSFPLHQQAHSCSSFWQPFSIRSARCIPQAENYKFPLNGPHQDNMETTTFVSFMSLTPHKTISILTRPPLFEMILCLWFNEANQHTIAFHASDSMMQNNIPSHSILPKSYNRRASLVPFVQYAIPSSLPL